jgi:hypothetical protein
MLNEQAKQQEFRFQLRRSIAVKPEEARRQPWQHREDDDPGHKEDQGLDRERRKDQAERHDGSEVGNEARGKVDIATPASQLGITSHPSR